MTVLSALTAESTSHVADIGGLPVRYHDAGSETADIGTGPGDAGTVVLLHGGGPGASSWSNFGQTMPVVAGHYRTVMMDLPGYGGTAARPATGHFFTVAAEALAGLLDHLGIGKAHLIGNSLGGGTAMRFALKYPKRTGRLGASPGDPVMRRPLAGPSVPGCSGAIVLPSGLKV